MAPSSPPPRRDSFPPSVLRVGGGEQYEIGVWRNVVILQVLGAIDDAFFETTRAACDSALRFEPEGFGMVVLIGPSARVPGFVHRLRALELRKQTREHARAIAVLIEGEGFYARTLRRAVSFVIALRRERGVATTVSAAVEAATFVVEHACKPGVRVDDLYQALAVVRVG